MHLELKTLFYCRQKSGCHGFCSPPWLILPAAVRLTHSFLPHILPLLPAFGNTPKYRCCLYSPLRVSHRLQDELQAQHFIQAPLSRPLPQPLPRGPPPSTLTCSIISQTWSSLNLPGLFKVSSLNKCRSHCQECSFFFASQLLFLDQFLSFPLCSFLLPLQVITFFYLTFFQHLTT